MSGATAEVNLVVVLGQMVCRKDPPTRSHVAVKQQDYGPGTLTTCCIISLRAKHPYTEVS